ncbi:hypothetical protein D8S78_10230 [Natrialba swarupiae]|nr:hypothetical protein [Natrialba swarupiae]
MAHRRVEQNHWLDRGLANKPRSSSAASGSGEELVPEDVTPDIGGEGDDESSGGILRRSPAGYADCSSVASKLAEVIAALVPSLPIEELVATVVRELVRGLIEYLEPETEKSSGGAEPSAEQAEAHS